MLLPDSMELRICVPYNSRSTAWASFDGRGRVELKREQFLVAFLSSKFDVVCSEGDHIKVTASRYPFPTVCADKQSTDWFHAISRTLKWNERERQKSFVVVEESPIRGKHQHHTTTEKRKAALDDSNDIDEEDEVSDDEETGFDIDDSTADAQTTAPSGTQTPQDTTLGHEKAVEQGMLSRAAKSGARRSSRSRSRSRPRARPRTRSPASSSEQSGVETPGRYAGPHHAPPSFHHVSFNLPDSPSSRQGSVNGTADRQHAKQKEREVDIDNVRTPTVSSGWYGRLPARSRSSDHGGRRAFAVWGEDESDSAASDNDNNDA